MPAGFRDRVIEVVAALPPGQVVSYGDVAAEAGYPGAARGVGAVLASGVPGLPWWRVVTVGGRLVPGNEADHARRLRAEGVTVRDGRVAPDAGRGHAGPARGRSRTLARMQQPGTDPPRRGRR